jgi:hypothetical protein
MHSDQWRIHARFNGFIAMLSGSFHLNCLEHLKLKKGSLKEIVLRKRK